MDQQYNIQNGGSGAAPAPFAPQVMAAAARLKAQNTAPAQVASNGADVDAIRQQMQASRAVGQNYTQQMMQAGAGGAPDYGQAHAAQLQAMVQAFRQRQAFYARVAQMPPEMQRRATTIQSLMDAGLGDAASALQGSWAAQDALGDGGQ